jgi:hypothetical protein
MKSSVRFLLLALLPLVSCSEQKEEGKADHMKRPDGVTERRDDSESRGIAERNRETVPDDAKEDLVKDLLAHPGPPTKEQTRSAIQLMRSGDIGKCKELLESMPVGPFYETLLSEFAERYSKEDPAAAIAWIKQLPPEGHLQRGYSVIARNAAADPAKSEAFIQSITDQGLKAEFSAGYLLGLSQRGDIGEIRELLGNPERLNALGLNSEIIFDSIVRGGAAHASVAQSLQTVGLLIGSGIEPKGSLGDTAIRQAVAKDPAAAASYLSANQDLPYVNRIAEPALEAWAASSPIEAAEWLKSQQGGLRDAGAAGLAKAVARSEPQSAVIWAISIGDPALRTATLSQIASRSKFEREQIRTLIQNSEFDQQTKDSYLAIFR